MESTSATERDAQESGDARKSLAAWLRAGRDRRKLTIDDVAKITKIQPRILEKLESGQLEGLPAEVFVKGFVRSFAKCVGLDENEALQKYSAAQAQPASPSGPAVAVAKAMVETLARPIDINAVLEARIAQATPPQPTPAVTAPVEIEAPLVIEEPIAIETPVVEAVAPIETPKKKKNRRGKQRNRKRKQAQEQKAAAQDAIETTVFDKLDPIETIETGPVAKIDAESLEATSIEAKTTEAVIDEASDHASAVPSEALAEGSGRIAADVVEEPVPQIEVEAEELGSGTWQPTMPPISTAPSVPWRRPSLPTVAATRASVPTLLIDDADPDSADREREDRVKEPQRLSFLPPILLDREDRSSRQGGLTLAVIILLVAATLTLSYLMRRPSPSGDGVTLNESPAATLIA